MTTVSFPTKTPRNDRVAARIKNNLGVIRLSGKKGEEADGVMFRLKEHHKLDKYYENTQHDDKQPWDRACESEDYVSIRKRQPRINYPFAKVLCSRVTAKLIGSDSFPKMTVPQDPDTEEYLDWIVRASRMRSKLLEPIRRMCATGSVFVRFGIVEGAFQMSFNLSKHCYPVFADSGELEAMTVVMVFEDKEDVDTKGKPKKKWFRRDYGPDSDVQYDTPEFKEGISWQDVPFQVVESVDHNLGFVQGEWFTTTEGAEGIDGDSLYADILDFMDEIDYNLSQSSQVIQYNQDPQLLVSGLTEDDLDQLIRSSQKAWNLGREGDARFLETGLQAVEVARDFRDRVRLSVQDISRIVLMDPEKVAGHAQSGKALEILHGPMKELITELRPSIETTLIRLITKMAVANLIVSGRGEPSPVTIPPGFVPQSFDIRPHWRPVFQGTLEDLRTKVSIAAQVAGASLVSRETMTRWLAEDFDIDNVEEEIQRIDTQPSLFTPFGQF